MPLPGEIADEASSPASPVSAPRNDQFFYGGQAVIEGVMMRGKRHYAVAIRLPKTKEIVVDRGELKAADLCQPDVEAADPARPGPDRRAAAPRHEDR